MSRIITLFLLILLCIACKAEWTPPDNVKDEFNQLPPFLQQIIKDNIANPGAPVIQLPRTSSNYKLLLAVDGGGFRGVIPTMVLLSVQRAIKEYALENRAKFNLPSNVQSIRDFQIDFTQLFDYFGGNSAGTYITAILATNGANLAQALPIITKLGLQPTDPISLMIMFLGLGKAVGQYPIITTNNETYFASGNAASTQVNVVLSQLFGNTLLSGCQKTCIFMSTDLAAQNVVAFYKNAKSGDVGTHIPLTESLPWGHDMGNPALAQYLANKAQNVPGREFLLWQVARVSSAMVNFMFPFEIQTVSPTKPEDGFKAILMDGAISSNTPVGIASAFLMQTQPDLTLEKFAILSLGTTRCGAPIFTIPEYVNAFQQWPFAWSSAVTNNNPHINLIEALLLRDLTEKSTQVPRFLRVNRNFDRNYIPYITDPKAQQRYSAHCNASYAGSDLPTLIDIGGMLAEEYYVALKLWISTYMF